MMLAASAGWQRLSVSVAGRNSFGEASCLLHPQNQSHTGEIQTCLGKSRYGHDGIYSMQTLNILSFPKN